MIRTAHNFVLAALLAAALHVGFPAGIAAAGEAPAPGAKSVAFLLVHFQNDNEELEPTSEAERARMVTIREQFKTMMEASGRYKFVEVADADRAKFTAGQQLGHCAGCEFDYGSALGAESVAWIEVQKVSNLIMNLNVFMSDVAGRKSTFVHSVDIRGNTDDSWARSLSYLVKNYLLGAPGQ